MVLRMKEGEQIDNSLRERAEEIFCGALEIEVAEQQSAYIEDACANDGLLYAAVQQMLNSQAEAETFFLDSCPTRISAAEVSQTLSDMPEFFENLGQILPDDDEVGKQIGNYKLLQKIGEGGGGNVYLAEQRMPVRRQVALKIIKLGMNTKSVIARFKTERQALAMMEHPNIAHVLNAGETDTGRPFFVMELVHGIKITTYCDQNKLGIQSRLELFVQTCHAIQHAHQKGIIHRDIKPSNVLITIHDGRPMPKVIDFGIAKATSGDLLSEQTFHTAQEPFVGTPAYMSPEQADFAHTDIDMRSDVYSLGTLLYELLAGHPPFDQDALMKSGIEEMRRTLRECEPKRPSVRYASLPEVERGETAANRREEPHRLSSILSRELDWVVMKALEKDRDRRYQTVDGLAEDVLRYLRHEPVMARPPTRRYRFCKLVLRNKGVFVSIAAISLTMIAGLGMSSWLFVKERAALEAMKQARKSEAILRKEAETREKISQAAVLLSRGQASEADLLMSDVEIPVVKPSLEASSVFAKLAEWNVQQGRWGQAADHMLKLSLAMQVDKSDMTDSATRLLLKIGPTLVAAGDMENYRRLVRQTIVRFSGTENPVAAEQVIKISIIAPMDMSTRNALKPLAEVVLQSIISSEPKTPQENYYVAWRAFAIAWYKYRDGDYAGAEEWGQRCLAYEDSTPTRLPMCHTLLAMADYQLGHEEDARFEWALSRAMLNTKFLEGLGKIDDLGSEKAGFWHDWVMAYLLQQEAKALIDS